MHRLISAIVDGRRFVYLRSLPCLCIGSVGVANSHSVPTVMFWRVVQAFGASSAMSVGAGVIGDIYRLEERGYAMGLFFGVSHSHAACVSRATFTMIHWSSSSFPTHLLSIRLPSSGQQSPPCAEASRRNMPPGVICNGPWASWGLPRSYRWCYGFRRL